MSRLFIIDVLSIIQPGSLQLMIGNSVFMQLSFVHVGGIFYLSLLFWCTILVIHLFDIVSTFGHVGFQMTFEGITQRV